MRGRGAAGRSADRGAPARRGRGRLCPGGAGGGKEGRGWREARPRRALPSPAPPRSACGRERPWERPRALPRRGSAFLEMLIHRRRCRDGFGCRAKQPGGQPGNSGSSGRAVTSHRVQRARRGWPMSPVGLVGAPVLTPVHPWVSVF